MPKFTVPMYRTLRQLGRYTVEADTEEDAFEKVVTMVADSTLQTADVEWQPPYHEDFSLEVDEDYEVEEAE